MSDKQVVVLAEDEPQIANLVRYKLEKSGYEVFWGEDGQRAWEIIQENKPDLVIIDVMMPVMDGFEVLRAMKGEPGTRAIPAIMLTARSMEEDILKGFEEGAVDYMVKPFSVTELAARVKATIGRNGDS